MFRVRKRVKGVATTNTLIFLTNKSHKQDEFVGLYYFLVTGYSFFPKNVIKIIALKEIFQMVAINSAQKDPQVAKRYQ